MGSRSAPESTDGTLQGGLKIATASKTAALNLLNRCCCNLKIAVACDPNQRVQVNDVLGTMVIVT